MSIEWIDKSNRSFVMDGDGFAVVNVYLCSNGNFISDLDLRIEFPLLQDAKQHAIEIAKKKGIL